MRERVRADGGSSTGIVVRPAHPRDARATLELRRAVAAEGRWVRDGGVETTLADERRLARRSWSTRGAFLVAEDQGRIVGVLRIAREREAATAHVATFGMAVAADHRGRGVGEGLLREALAWAMHAGVRKVELSVYPDNEAAMALYTRLGFGIEGRLVRHSLRGGAFQDEVLMGLWLEGR